MTVRRCQVCGSGEMRGRSRYCSAECFREAERRRVAAWRAANLERSRAGNRARERRRRAKELAERPATVTVDCIECGDPFERPITGRQRLCSRRCRNRRAKAQRDPAGRVADARRYREKRADRRRNSTEPPVNLATSPDVVTPHPDAL